MKAVVWMGSSREDLKRFPEMAQDPIPSPPGPKVSMYCSASRRRHPIRAARTWNWQCNNSGQSQGEEEIQKGRES